MRIGLFGGTFDPIHVGHLILAEQCREQAALDRVLFIPAARPPHKRAQPLTPFAQRVDMLELAIAGHPPFAIDQLELDRPGPSFTVDTLEALRQRQPGDEWFLMVGADSLRDFPSWFQPERIATLATLLVVPRPGDQLAATAHLADLPQIAARLQHIHMPPIGIAARDLRQRVAEGRSVRFFVPRAVEAYIEEKNLYRAPVSDPAAAAR